MEDTNSQSKETLLKAISSLSDWSKWMISLKLCARLQAVCLC